MRYLVKLDKKGVPVPGSLVYNTSYPQKGRWMEIETLEKDEEGYCIQPPKPYNYFRKLKFYYVVDECCNPIAGSNVNAYCKPTGNYFEFFPGCLLKVCPPPLEINVNINGEIICYGGTTSYTVTATGGYPPYTGVNTYTVPAGTYTATVTDSHGTTASTQVVIPASVNSQITASIVSHTDILCNGDGDGTFTVGASGGVSPYQYAITAIDSVPVTNPIYQSSPIFSNLGPGEYQVTVMDDNECIGITAVEIYEPAVLEVSLDSTDVLCYGESTGTITTTVTGGVGPYRYIWSGGSLVSNAQNQNALPANTYNVLVIDHNGCQATAQATITQPPQLVVSGSVTNITCYGDDDGAINLSVTGGVAPYEYLWNTGATTEDLTGLEPGRYRVTVTDANGCIKILNFSVTQPAQLVVSESHVSPLCFGDMTGSITLLVGGGVTPYTYAWTGPDVNPTSQNQTGLGSGLYSVTITDDNGCQTTISNINLQVTEITATLNYIVTDPLTGESTVTVDAVSGGTAPYQYSLDGGPYQLSNTFTNVFPTPGGHDVTIKDFNDCIITLLIDIPLPCLCYSWELTEDKLTDTIISWVDCNENPQSQTVSYPQLGTTGSMCAQLDSVNINSGTYTLSPSTFTCTTDGDCASAWRSLTTACEPETQFNILREITGLSTPENVWYDETLNRVWVADGDNFIKGNVYWFDPTTAMTEADMTYYPGIKSNALYFSYIDEQYRRIYFWGTDTNNLSQPAGSGVITGLVVYDMDTNTHYQVSYGSNFQYERMLNFVSGNYIYGNDNDNQEIVIFDRTSNPITILSSISIYSTGDENYFTYANKWTNVGNMIWIVAGSGNYAGGNIGVFNQNLILQATITLPGTSVVPSSDNGNDAWWQTGFYDEQTNKFYVNDLGSNNLYIVDVNTTTYTSGTVTTRSLTYMTENRKYVFGVFSVDPVSNKLYASFQKFDQIGVSPITSKSYEVNRETTQFVKLFNNIGIGELKIVNDGTYTNSLMGVFGGNVLWGTGYPSPAYTDGTVTIYNNTTPGNNSGIVNVLTLEQYIVGNGVSTGITKLNLPYINNVINPDYIPPYLDETICPIIYTETCPTITSKPFATGCYYEFDIINTVKLNPAIAYIKVNLLDVGNSVITSTTITAPFTTNYYSGSLTSVAGTYHISVEYYDSDDVLIPCT